MSDFQKLRERIDAARVTRDLWVNLWQDCYDLAIPNRARFYQKARGVDNMEKISDSTAIFATQEFANRMQAGIMPPFAQWFEFAAGSEVDAANRPKIEAALQEVATYVWETLQQTNMDSEINESFYDLAVGTGNLLIEDGDAETPIKFTAVPLTNVLLEPGPFNSLDGKYRTRAMPLKDLPHVWPNGTFSETMRRDIDRDPQREVNIVECVMRDRNARGTETYDFRVVGLEYEEIIATGSFSGGGSSPWVTYRWSKASGETWGRGPLLQALPDIRTLNAVVEMTLENADFAISGIWQADDDGVINPDTIEIVPGTIIPKSPTSNGLQGIAAPGRFDVSNMLLDDMRHSLRRAMFNDQLGKPDKTPMTATEVYERMADLARQVGAAYGRLHNELSTPLLRRVVYMLQKQNKIELPKLNGRRVKVVNVSPLAQGQHQENVAKVGRFLQMMNEGFGPQMVNMVLKAEDAATYMARQLGVPENLIRSEVERQALIQAVSQMTQQPEEARTIA